MFYNVSASHTAVLSVSITSRHITTTQFGFLVPASTNTATHRQ